MSTTCPGTGEDRAEGASFWHAFLTPFWGPKNIFFFKRNDAEAYVWPKSDTRQAQQKLRLNLTYNITNLRKKLPKAQTSVKSNVTSQNKNLENKLRHDKALRCIESYGFMYGEAWAKPQNLSFCTWRGLSEAGEAHHIARIRLCSRKRGWSGTREL